MSYYGNYGDLILNDLAVKAGATYGSEVVKVVEEILEGESDGRWALEIWTGFHTLNLDGQEELHWLAGDLRHHVSAAVWDSVTIEVEGLA